MLRGYRGVFAAIAGLAFVLGASLQLTWFLYPEQPNLTGNTGYKEELPNYRASGADCEPAQIERLGDGKRAERTKACQETEEQHRLQANDLIQQRRSADAADAMAVLSYQQTRISAWGVALGFITMAAAIAAAFYARSAAIHTESSAKSFIETERAILHVVGGEVGKMTSDGRPNVAFEIINRGRASGKVIEIGSRPRLDGSKVNFSKRWTVVPPDGKTFVASFDPPAKGEVLVADCWIRYRTIGPDIHTSNFTAKVYWFDPPSGNFMLNPKWIVETSNENGHPDDT